MRIRLKTENIDNYKKVLTNLNKTSFWYAFIMVANIILLDKLIIQYNLWSIFAIIVNGIMALNYIITYLVSNKKLTEITKEEQEWKTKTE